MILLNGEFQRNRRQEVWGVEGGGVRSGAAPRVLDMISFRGFPEMESREFIYLRDYLVCGMSNVQLGIPNFAVCGVARRHCRYWDSRPVEKKFLDI